MPRRKNKKQAVGQPGPIRWEFDPDIPTEDFFDGRNLEGAVTPCQGLRGHFERTCVYSVLSSPFCL
jgi:hypothetical protein